MLFYVEQQLIMELCKHGTQVIIFKESALLTYENKGAKHCKNNNGFQKDFGLPH